MSEPKHTPGPWQGDWAPHASVEGSKKSGFYFGPFVWPVAVKDGVNGYPEPGNGLVAVCCTEHDQRLIAATPEMYAALADLIEAVMSSDMGYEDYVLQSLFRARRVMTGANPAYENPMPSTSTPTV